ncbi:unnamed protein product [Dracunculus medinensis]|uniref:Pept_C1 domain-containing protein n=1 Tax=Dracunculus medinensis TaxID=318479 RepID=A0A158Q4R2_DRAME|nr:unnamed protein product [Dracunculus medinensis]
MAPIFEIMLQKKDYANSCKLKAKYNPFASRARATDVDFDDMVRIADSNRMLTKEQLYGDTLSHLTNLLSISVKLPQNFDSREKWPLCWSVHQVTNQGGCGSCWAMSAASVISDRICIASNYEKQYQISAQDLTSCCTECGGCQGSHWALAPFTYWKKNGLVTGGNYGTFEGCKPYSITPKCGSPCSTDYYEKKATPKCEKKCQILYGKTYNDDIIKGKKAYWLRGNNETTPAVQTSITQAINNHDPIDLLKREIFLYGPIQACFTVQEDFQHYSSGIYHRFNNSDSKELYGHCAKMIGWGNSNGTEYWLYMNTWGREWGFFRIALNEIPEEAIAGLPFYIN